MLTGADLGQFGDLSRAIGLTTATGTNSAWFEDPLGQSHANGLKHVLTDTGQRDALLGFVDDVLGPPAARVDGTVTWVPLFRHDDPVLTLSAVVEVLPGAVRLGVGVEHTTGDEAPFVTTRIHVPLIHVPNGATDSRPDNGSDPDWLLIGHPGGRLAVEVDATFTTDAPVPGEAFLGGATARIAIPTHEDDTLELTFELTDLQVPGATQPTTRRLDLDALEDVGLDVLDFAVGLVREQASSLDLTDPAFRHIAGLTGILGLRGIPGLPDLPVGDLATAGVSAVVEWVDDVLGDDAARDLWLAELARLVGGTADPGRDAVQFDLDDVALLLGLRVTRGTTGHSVLTPWLELGYQTRPGVRVTAAADLARVDTADGSACALPRLVVEAVFGADAGAARLTTGGPVEVGSVHVGVRVDGTGDGPPGPAFALTLHDVDISAGGSPSHHDVIDLSSPDAALDAVDTAVSGAISSALAALGDAGALLSTLLGVDPPAAVSGVSVVDLLADPLGAVAGYYRALLDDAAAAAEVLGALQALLSGAATPVAVAGAGTAVAPWRVGFATVGGGAGVGLAVWHDGHRVRLAAALDVATGVLDSLEVGADLRLTLIDADLDTSSVRFGSDGSARLRVAPTGAGPATLSLGLGDLQFDGVGVELAWAAGRGMRFGMLGDGLALAVRPPSGRGPGGLAPGAVLTLDIPLPVVGADGTITWAPDWDDLQLLLGHLLADADIPLVDVALDLLGWATPGGSVSGGLSLAALVDDPALALRTWAADVALDCGHVRAVMAVATRLLSGYAVDTPYGLGTAELPYRAPIGGSPTAPALTAWTDPPCPPPPPSAARGAFGTISGLDLADPGDLDASRPIGAELVQALTGAAAWVPHLADLLFARPGLADGFDGLVARWTGTDGVTGPPATAPDGVETVVLPGYGYAELAALARTSDELVHDLTPAAVVHVGCGADWGADRPDRIDATGGAAGSAPPSSTVPATGDGQWYVALAAPVVAGRSRPDGDGVAAQSTQLAAALAGRTAPVTLVGYGAAGAAAVRAAGDVAAVAGVVTVGTPWSPVSVSSFTTGAPANALEVCARLRPDIDPWPDDLLAYQATPLVRGADALDRALATPSSRHLPAAGDVTPRAGLTVRAAFGTLSAADATAALAAVVAAAVSQRAEAAAEAAAAAAVGPPEHLHLGIDVPAVTADLGGLAVAARARVELLAVDRGAGAAVSVATAREVVLGVSIAVGDGWLVGGPGAANRDVEVRWVEASIRVPVSVDGSTPAGSGTTEIILHEARALGASRPRWVVRADGEIVLSGLVDAPTVALPEVKAVLAEVVGRVRAAAPALATLFETVGIVRAGGLDPGALDRLLFDPAGMLGGLVGADAAGLAASLNAVVGAAPDPARPVAAVDLALGGDGEDATATVRFDLAARTIDAHASVDIPGLVPLTLGVTVGPGAQSCSVALGRLDPTAGGLALRAGASLGAGVVLAVDHRRPAAADDTAATSTVALLPVPDSAGLERLVALVLPAALAQAVAEALRRAAGGAGRAALDAALDAVGLLDAPADNGTRRALLPVGLLSDPGAWVRHRADPLAAVVAVLEALAPVVVPARGAASGWPLDPAFGVTYELAGDRLEIVAHGVATQTVDGVDVVVDVRGGLSLSASAAAQPVVEVALTADGWGLGVDVAPTVVVNLLRPAPAAPLPIHPAGAGLGGAISSVGVSLVPGALNGLIAHRTDPAALLTDVAQAVHDLGEAMGLMSGAPASRQFDGALVDAFAQHPATALVDRLPSLASAGLAALATALDPTGALVGTSAPSATVRRFTFGATGVLHVDLDGTPGAPAVEVGGRVDLPGGVGSVVVERLRLTPDGVQVAVRGGPVEVELGTMVLRPVVVVRAGVSAAGFERGLGLGVGLDAAGAQSVEVRWALDATPPVLAAVDRTTAGEQVLDDAAEAALRLVGVALSVGSGVVAHHLGTVISDRATAKLQDVVFTGGGRTVDPAFVTDLLDADALLTRAKRLLWNCATGPDPLSVTIEGTVTLGLVAQGAQLGLRITLADHQSFTLASGDVDVALEVDAGWVEPSVPAGLSVYVLSGSAADDLDLDLGVSVAGIGLRFTKTAGPLVELGGVSLDGLAVHLYGEVTASGVGGGVRLQLSGLALAPAGGGGDNAMADSLLNDSGEAGGNDRPAFSPSLALQQHPGEPFRVSLRAGDPPGPWFVVVQRQLGPLYVERIGFDAVEQNGAVTRISFLFSGSVSLFGLSAAVEQLSLTWNGGDVLAVSSWSADLMGLAVSADLAGVSLAGGLLKSVDSAGVVSYVGMLVGRFATYGLSVFGGYATDPHGHASFFVFGAVTGPIGGPPAFFLTGLGGGLGINRGLVIPTELSHFGDYPFIQALDPSASVPDPMTQLQRLNAYFPHQPGSFWFAAGISFTSFALVDGVAVVAVSFGDGLEINLLGLARMALPRPQVPLVSIELALLARFSTSEGVFMILAQLTDNSWLLYRDIRLTGGFAFAIWWKGPNAGQFVLTLGGYHPDFHHDGYPDVPRLGLSWKISNSIEMKGTSYFALTSEALMAGTAVSVSVDFGWVWARIEFGADGIVYFDPFFFKVSAYARISAGIDIDLGLFSISLSITIGASITVWGPEFAGKVVFEIGPCDVPISFGPQTKSPGATISWAEFVGKYLEDAGGGRARALSGITGRGSLPTSTGGDVSAPSSDGSAALPFVVFAEFEISFTTTIPTSTFRIGSTPDWEEDVELSNGAATTLGLAPVGAENLRSMLTVTLSRKDGSEEPDLAKLAVNRASGPSTPDGSRTGTDSFPLGVWGQPKAIDGPAPVVPSGDVVTTGNRLVLVAGVEAPTRGPQIDYYQVTSGTAPLPLSATGALRATLLQEAAALGVQSAADVAAAFQLATDTLFGDQRSSPVARAAYANSRVAPPRFGNLADGLAAANGDKGDRPPAPAKPARTPPAVRAPFLAAHLASGPGAARRATVTTVTDGRTKRRPAPTTASVRGRLGTQLPLVLERTAPPTVATDTTVRAGLALPRTEVPGTVRSLRLGPTTPAGLAGLVGGLRTTVQPGDGGPHDSAAPRRLSTGDVVVLHQRDAAIDVDEARPRLAVRGRARVVMLSGAGIVHDDDVRNGRVEVPPRTSLVAVQSDGDADASDGLSGWHERSRVALVGGRAAIAAGCTVYTDGVASPESGWGLAGELTLGASRLLTRFTRPMRVLAIALTGAANDTPAGLDVQLVGGRLSRHRDGSDRAPVMVTLGSTAVLVYQVVPDRAATSLSVSVVPGADWVVSGMFGGGAPGQAPLDADGLAALIARQGLVATTAQLTVMDGDGCEVRWEAPGRTRRGGGSPR